MTEKKEEGNKKLSNQRAESEQTGELEKSKDAILEVLLKFASLSAIVVGFISSLSHYLFAINAEKFYGVSSLYFYNDRIFDFGATVLFILIPLFIWLIPVFVEKVSKKSEFNFIDRILFSIVVAILVLLESLLFSDYFFENVTLIVSLSLGLSIISFIGYDLLFFLIARNNAKDTEEKSKLASLLFNESKPMRIISGSSYVLTAVVILLMAFLLIIKFSPLDVKNQKSYEFISGEESGYRIVVGHYQDSVILMKGSTKKCTENGHQLTIIKGDYRIEPLGERQIEYHRFGDVDVK